VYVNLFVTSDANFMVNNKAVQIMQQNNYPWEGNLRFTVNPKSTFAFNLHIRIPGWARNEAMPSDLYQFENNDTKNVEIKINGQVVNYSMKDGYAVLNKNWKKGDIVEVNLPMDVRRVVANKNVKDDIGKVSLQRGPLMYCAEWPDNFGKASNIIVPDNAVMTTEFRPDLLNGVMVIKSEVPEVIVNKDENSVSTVNRTMTAIPYYSWAHRGKGEMMLWFPTKVKDVDLLASGN
jgi:DUF1680 family protein